MQSIGPVDVAEATVTRSADDEQIERAVAAGDPTVLLAALLQLTDDPELARIQLVPTPMMGAFLGRVLTPEDEALVHRKAIDYLTLYRERRAQPALPSTTARLKTSMDVLAGGEFPESYVGAALEELAFDPNPRGVTWDKKPSPQVLAQSSVLVIGTGLGGIAAAIQGKKLGLPIVVIEKNAEVGGTWHENQYPGARVDVPSHHYSYSFEIDHKWKHFFAPQPEIAEYVCTTAKKHGVYESIEFDTEVISLVWDEATDNWVVTCRRSDGAEIVHRARFVISAVGMLNRSKLPDIAGLNDYEGIAFHTSRWDQSVDLAGKRVGLIGTGASGLQLAPMVAQVAEHLTVFQRTPQWMAPVPIYRSPVSEDTQWLMDEFPTYKNWFRMKLFYSFCDKADELYEVDPDWQGDPRAVNARTDKAIQVLSEHLHEQLNGDAELIAKCTPDYPPMSRRFVVDNGWLQTLTRPNVSLVTERIEKVTPAGVLTADGIEHSFDVMVLASGFHANKYLWPMNITGRGGVELGQQWSKDGPRAYLGITIHNFPNLFCIYGPNTNPKSGSPCMWGEVQARYALNCVRLAVEQGYTSIEVKQPTHDEYNYRVDERLSKAIWNDERAVSYYRNEFGRVGTNMPWLADEYWAMTRWPNPEDFELRGRAEKVD